jgi:hypothetical protein
VHPIERLRFVARARDVDQRLLAREAVAALGVLADEPFGLVTSCRRLLDRHPEAGVLWWACARLLDAADPRAEARAVARDLDDDALGRSLALDVPERATLLVVSDPAGGSALADGLDAVRSDLVVLEVDDPAFDIEAAVDASGSLGDPQAPGSGPTIVVVEPGAVGPDAALVLPGTEDGIAAARAQGVGVWLAVGPGRRLAGPLFDAVAARVAGGGGRPGAFSAVGNLEGPELLPLPRVARIVEPRRFDCPSPPELLRPWTG